MSNRFYVNGDLNVSDVVIQGPEAHHIAIVCRFNAGDNVCLFNGDGHQYEGTVVSASKQRVSVKITGQETPARELLYSLHVAAPLPKGERAQYLIEKLTEIGVARYIPLRTHRTVVFPGQGKIEKLHRYVIEASKQCGRNVLMEVTDPVDWCALCSQPSLPSARFLAHPGIEESGVRGQGSGVRSHESGARSQESGNGDHEAGKQAKARDAVICAVGPEGGFTDEELDLAKANHWQVVGLGPRILRVETAAIVLAIRAQESVA